MNKVLANGHIEFVGTLSRKCFVFVQRIVKSLLNVFFFLNSVVIPQLTNQNHNPPMDDPIFMYISRHICWN